MLSEEHAALMKRMDEAWNQRKIELVDELFSPDFRSRTGFPYGSDREAQKKIMRMFFDAFSEGQWETADMMSHGDRIVFRIVGEANHTGEFMGVPATGNRVCMGGMGMYRVADGMVVEAWQYFDMPGLMQQMGVSMPGMEASMARAA